MLRGRGQIVPQRKPGIGLKGFDDARLGLNQIGHGSEGVLRQIMAKPEVERVLKDTTSREDFGMDAVAPPFRAAANGQLRTQEKAKWTEFGLAVWPGTF